MNSSANGVIMKFLMPQQLLLSPNLWAAPEVLCNLRFRVHLLLYIEVHYVFALCAHGQLDLAFACFVYGQGHDFHELNLQAGPAPQPLKLFLVSFKSEKVNPSILSTHTKVIVSISCNACVLWRQIKSLICNRRMHFQILEKVKELEDKELTSFGTSDQLILLCEGVVCKIQILLRLW